MIDQTRARGPTLVLDAGNALSASPWAGNALTRQKAELILITMGELKTAAMAVGARDLFAGPAFLKEVAGKAKLKLLSANLTQDGKPVFDASAVVAVDGARVGLVGVGPAAATFSRFPGLAGGPPVPAALAEAKKLREKEKVDAVIVLAAVPLADALQLAREGGASVDLVLQSGDGRPAMGPQQAGSAFVIPTGERGRMVAKVDLDLSGKGPLFDARESTRNQQAISLLDQRIAEAKRRAASLREPAAVKSYQQMVKNFEERKAELKAQVAAQKGRAGRSLLLESVMLGSEVASDPGLQVRVGKLQPPGEAAEH